MTTTNWLNAILGILLGLSIYAGWGMIEWLISKHKDD